MHQGACLLGMVMCVHVLSIAWYRNTSPNTRILSCLPSYHSPPYSIKSWHAQTCGTPRHGADSVFHFNSVWPSLAGTLGAHAAVLMSLCIACLLVSCVPYCFWPQAIQPCMCSFEPAFRCVNQSHEVLVLPKLICKIDLWLSKRTYTFRSSSC